jgi:hypothetical protein
MEEHRDETEKFVPVACKAGKANTLFLALEKLKFLQVSYNARN